jgi:hypothetical protein
MMSKFLTAINELLSEAPAKVLLTPAEKQKKKDQDTLSGAQKRVSQGGKDKGDIDLVRIADLQKKGTIARLKQPYKEQEEEPVDPAAEPAIEPAAEPAVAEEPPPLTTEGEAFIVDVARLALHVELKKITLTTDEHAAIYQDVTPQNAKHVGNVIQAIIGRSPVGQIDPSGESFNSRIDPLLDSLKKN